MKSDKLTFAIILIVFVIVGIAIFRPVPIPDEKDCLVQKGVVLAIYESGEKDVTIRLTGVKTTFYINRGLEAGLDLQTLRSQLLNQEVTIKFPDYWTPLDWNNAIRHVSKVEWNDKTIFNELN